MHKDVPVTAFGHKLMMLYGRVHLSQGEFASAVGISSVALRKWESGASCPKAESLKRALEVLICQGALIKEEEQREVQHLWELAMKKGLKVPFDEMWFRGVMQAPVGIVPSADPAYADLVSSADSMPSDAIVSYS